MFHPNRYFKHFICYGSFKAVVPADGSKMLLYNLAKENHIEERDSEAKEYPRIAAKIKKWFIENPTDVKRIVIGETE